MRSKRPLALLVFAWGVQAIVTQSLLIREALVLMYGSELVWGVVLSAWLLGVAVGAAAGGCASPRIRRPDLGLAVVLLGLAAAGLGGMWLFRTARTWLHVPPGELLPLSKAAAAALLLVTPAGGFVGAAFPLACAVRGASAPGALSSVYTLESLGSLAGGAAFSFWAVEHLAPVQIVLLSGALTTAFSAALLVGQRRRGLVAVLILIGTGAAGSAWLVGDRLNRALVLRRWRALAPGYELVREAESRHQNLALARRAEQYSLFCDGHVSVDFPDPYVFVPRAHLWMCQHPAPRHVLVLGGGAEGLLAEILRHPVDSVDYVEPDPRQIDLLEPFLGDADRAALHDPRVSIHATDARLYVKTRRARFDLVIARLPEPASALRARFYTVEFFGELRRAMTPRSVLCMTAAAAPASLSPASAEYLASVRAALRAQFPEVVVGWGDPAPVLAATSPGLIAIDGDELTRRYTGRNVRSNLFDPAWFRGATDWFDPAKLRRRAAELERAVGAFASSDLRPAVYLQRLVLLERATGSPGHLVERLRSVSFGRAAAGVAAFMVLTLVVGRVQARRVRAGPGTSGWVDAAVTLSMFATGFATMAVSIVWLFAFQNLYGYVYQRIAWIVAVFMGGLAAGCRLTDRWAAGRVRRDPVPRAGDAEGRRRWLWKRLVLVDVLLAGLALAVPVILPSLGAMQTTPAALRGVEIIIFALVASTGVLCGAAFAMAGRFREITRGHVGVSAGGVVGADHAGACLGALTTGVLFVPVFGIIPTALLLAAVKGASAVVVLAACLAAGTRSGVEGWGADATGQQ